MAGGNGKESHGVLRVAVIGCGRISQVHLHTIAREPRVRLVAVADIDGKAASGAGEAFGVPAFTDPDDMLTKIHPDAVILCTPPNTHRCLAEAALSAGAHLLCEKPLAITLEDAEHMMHAAEAAGRTLMMASKFRYVQDVIKARGIIYSGILGEVILFENEFCSRVEMKSRWNSRADVAGGGVLIDNGCHSVDIVRYLLGPVEGVRVLFGKKWQQLEVEDTCHLHVHVRSGTMASIDLSWSLHKESPYYIHVYGTAGTLEVGWQGSRYRQSEKLDWIAFGNGYDKFQAVGAQLANFIDTVNGAGQPLITSADALESVRVIQTAYKNAELDRWDKVPM